MRSISAIGWLGVGLFLSPVWHNPHLWQANAPITHAELCSLLFGFLCVVTDFWMQYRD